MKTAISIPEEIFQSAESLAKRLGMSRSQLHAAAIIEYVKKRQDRQITANLNSFRAGFMILLKILLCGLKNW